MHSVKLFLRTFLYRFQQNKISVYAGHLTYSTMLSLVPMVMVVFSVFAMFPMFDEAANELKTYLYDNFAPSAGDMVAGYLETFANNAKKMGIVSMLGLFAVALLLINTITEALNNIWHDTPKRSIILSFAVYTGILIFGPLLAGASIAISSYIMSLKLFSEDGVFSIGFKLLGLLPFVLTWGLYVFLYMFVPNTQVKFKHAAIGALLSATFFTLGKQAFVWYVTTFPSYQAIYGAIAIIPIMIMWIHLSWEVVLLGGQVASCLKDMEMMKCGELSLPFTENKK